MGPSAEAYLIVVKRNNTGVFTAAIRRRLAEETFESVSGQLQNPITDGPMKTDSQLPEHA